MKKYKPYEHHLTVGRLLEFIKENNIPDDAPVMMQRIEDYYFEKGNWETHKKKGESYYNLLKHKEKAFGEYLNKEMYPDMSEEMISYLQNITQEELDSNLYQYYQAWCPVRYRDEPNVLFLDAHY